MPTPTNKPVYVVSLLEILWGGILIAITMALHGCGMVGVLRVNGALASRFKPAGTLARSLSILIATSWLIVMVHLVEVLVWAGFFYWRDAVNPNTSGSANTSLCYYFALLDYTCLGSNYNLRQNWRLLEGMISMTGLLTFAWSTGVLMTLAQEFQDQQMQRIKKRREKAASGHHHAPHGKPGAAD